MLKNDTVTLRLRPVDPIHYIRILTTFCPSCGSGMRMIQACAEQRLMDQLLPPCNPGHPHCAVQQFQPDDTLWGGLISVNGYHPGPVPAALTPDRTLRFGIETPVIGGPPKSRYLGWSLFR